MPAGPSGRTRTRKGCSRPQCPTSSSSLFSGSPGSGLHSCLIRGPLSARGAPSCDVCSCRLGFFLHSPVNVHSRSWSHNLWCVLGQQLARQPNYRHVLRCLSCKEPAKLGNGATMGAETRWMNALTLQCNATIGNYAGVTSLCVHNDLAYFVLSQGDSMLCLLMVITC